MRSSNRRDCRFDRIRGRCDAPGAMGRDDVRRRCVSARPTWHNSLQHVGRQVCPDLARELVRRLSSRACIVRMGQRHSVEAMATICRASDACSLSGRMLRLLSIVSGSWLHRGLGLLGGLFAVCSRGHNGQSHQRTLASRVVGCAGVHDLLLGLRIAARLERTLVKLKHEKRPRPARPRAGRRLRPSPGVPGSAPETGASPVPPEDGRDESEERGFPAILSSCIPLAVFFSNRNY